MSTIEEGLESCREALRDSDEQGGEYMHPSWVAWLLPEVERLREALKKIAADEEGGDKWYVDIARKALEMP